jgi:hypothetical protein
MHVHVCYQNKGGASIAHIQLTNLDRPVAVAVLVLSVTGHRSNACAMRGRKWKVCGGSQEVSIDEVVNTCM